MSHLQKIQRTIGCGYAIEPSGSGEAYFKQLTAERRVIRIHKGFPKATWEKDPSRNNEALDCRVYARAAASIYGLDRMSDYRWRRLEEALGMKANIPVRGVEISVTTETRSAPREPDKPKSRFTQRKAVKSDDPYL